MKTKHIIIAFVVLAVLLISSTLFAGSMDLKMKNDAYIIAIVSFLIFDLLLGLFLIFGKMKWIRKKNRSFDYLKTHYL